MTPARPSAPVQLRAEVDDRDDGEGAEEPPRERSVGRHGASLGRGQLLGDEGARERDDDAGG